MAEEIRAVIDVGTNSVKLLVAEVRGSSVHPLHEESHQTRLGQGFYESHLLLPAAIEHTAKTVAEFARKARQWQTPSIRVIATSAARDAVNQDDLLHSIKRESGIPVTVLSGEQEADWAFRGVLTDPQYSGRNLLVMDVGGGSTEFILGRNGARQFAQSFPLGSVRFHERFALHDPPAPKERSAVEAAIRAVLENEVGPALGPKLNQLDSPPALVATGGTSTILARMEHQMTGFDRAAIESTSLSLQRVVEQKDRLWNVPLTRRKTFAGLPSNRADVILHGVMIYEQTMSFFKLTPLHVSTRGIRFAALL